MTGDYRGNFIAGQWGLGAGEQFASVSPSDEQVIWSGRAATADQVDAAVSAADSAFLVWAKLAAADRAAYLHAFVEVLKGSKDELARTIAAEIGKPLWEAATEVAAMVGKLEPTEQAFHDRDGEASRPQGTGLVRTRFRPHGVVAVVGPYNFPGHMPNGHIMPALLAGNTVVFKPSESAPAVAQAVVECWSAAGLPSGVLNLVQGDASVGRLLCRHPDVRGVFFTGSRNAGESIRAALRPDQLCALEMGGNSPLIVWDSSDVDAAVLATIQSAYITSGQRCSAARRLIVPISEFGEAFLARLATAVRRIAVGRYVDQPEPFMGPLRLPSMVDHLMNVQERLVSQGGVLLVESRRLPLGRAFVAPGLIDVTSVPAREDEEVLGPLLQVIRVSDFESALREANNTQYGLAAGLFTEKAELYRRFAEVVRAGIVNWNQQLTGASPWAPFGGIKASGNFRPSGFLAADYCVYATGSVELEKLTLPDQLPPGVTLGQADSEGVSQAPDR